jgi:hypothetical protein
MTCAGTFIYHVLKHPNTTYILTLGWVARFHTQTKQRVKWKFLQISSFRFTDRRRYDIRCWSVQLHAFCEINTLLNPPWIWFLFLYPKYFKFSKFTSKYLIKMPFATHAVGRSKVFSEFVISVFKHACNLYICCHTSTVSYGQRQWQRWQKVGNCYLELRKPSS